MNKSLRILIGALSGWNMPERRRRCRQTWMKELTKTDNIQAVFLVGAGGRVTEPTVLDDILLLPCPDDYPSLPQRTRWFCEWALQRDDWDYLFKCDDDTYICMERLSRFHAINHDYIGAEWKRGVNYGSGGAGYFLSRRAAKVVAEALKDYPQGAEDLLVGKCLSEAEIAFQLDKRFIPFGNREQRPTPDNQIISTHATKWPWLAHDAEFLGRRPKVTSQLKGRLGNQLFQIAAALGIAEKCGHEPVFSPAIIHQQPLFFSNLPTGEMPLDSISVGDSSDFGFNENVFENPTYHVTTTGYMQSERYFEHCPERIREAFRIDDHTVRALNERFGGILETQPVGIHIRRGDYVKKQRHHPVQPAAYYLRALREMDKLIDVESVLCMSDDPEWCEAQLATEDNRIVVVSGQCESLDLALLSLCKHHILSSSTFSWWGAWLGETEGQKVILPDKWFGPSSMTYSEVDLIPKRWMRLSSLLSSESRHPRGYLLNTQPNGQQQVNQVLRDTLINFLIEEGGSVIDLGCGEGEYVKAFRAAGIKSDGSDGNPNTTQLTAGVCGVVDLTEPQRPTKTYDWAMALNIWNSIPISHTDIFFDNLHQYNRQGIIVSWNHYELGLKEESIKEHFERAGYLEENPLSLMGRSQDELSLLIFRRKTPLELCDGEVLQGEHPCWSGPIHLYANGRMARPGIDEGRYSIIKEERLILDWDHWATEELFWDADAKVYRAPNKAFIVKTHAD